MPALRILHVDDDESIRELAALAFDLGGDVQVQSAASGGEALRLLQEGASPDLLLLDVMMPDMDGPTLLNLIRIEGVSAPAVFMTAQTQDQDLARLKGLGAIGVIIKPFDPMLLSAKVRALMAEAA